VIAAIVLVIAGQDDEEEELDFGPCPITLSPNGPIPPGC
jgi:hypothetical protein